MRKIAMWEVRHPKTVLLIAILLLIPSLIGFINTKVNYDVFSYLPEDLESIEGENLMDEVFNNAGMSIVVTGTSDRHAVTSLKNKISKVKGISNVIWIDDLIDTGIPVDIMPDELKDVFYSKDGNRTIMLVQYSDIGSSDQTLEAIEEVKDILDDNSFITGLTVLVDDIKEICETQAIVYMLFAAALALIVMSIMMESWFLPLVLLAALGLAVAYNMGTNFFQGSISFLTACVAAILQLAVTMDYSIFLIDRYEEEKSNFDTREEAMTEAMVQSISALAGSSLTTFFGFSALCFMRLKLGFDIGFVMAKGVILGVITVIFVLPVILLLLEKPIHKYRHRSFVPDFSKINSFIINHRKILVILFVVLLIPAYFTQTKIQKYYNMDKALPEYLNSIAGLHSLEEDFGMASSQFVIIDDSLPAGKLTEMENKIDDLDGISLVLAYNKVVGTAIPESIIPEDLLSICKKDNYQMFLINSEYGNGTKEMTSQLDQIDSIIKSYDSNALVTGEGAITQDLIDVTDVDFKVTTWLSIIAIFILIAISFKSISLPVILVLSIELAIWINLSISVLTGTVVSFVDPICVNCIQLGATVDYAILLTTRYREACETMPHDIAIKSALNASGRSILQSAAVFFVATFGICFICDIKMVTGMCFLLARGALISALVIQLFLAPVLCSCSKIISRTTRGWISIENN